MSVLAFLLIYPKTTLTKRRYENLQETRGEQGVSVKEALKSKEFYILWLTILFGGVGMSCLDMYKAFGQKYIKDDSFLAMIGAMAGIFNCGGRVIWGIIGNRFSFKVILKVFFYIGLLNKLFF